MPIIKNVFAREILDSRGNPTIEVEVITESGACGRSIVPSGASTGMYEAFELNDNDKNRYQGLGKLKAVSNVNDIIKDSIVGVSTLNQHLIDNIMIKLDGTENKSRLGANAILAVSLSCAKAAANYLKIPLYKYLGGFNSIRLPMPMMNILNGGAHADFCIDFQEIMIVPVGADSVSKAIQMGSEVFHCLKKILKKAGHTTSVGDEGGYAPKLKSNLEAFDYVIDAIKLAGYTPGSDIAIAIDVAASEFYDEKQKIYELKADNKKYDYRHLVDEFYAYLIANYPIISIEDGLAEDDWEGWEYMSKKLSKEVMLVGDDLFVTNKKRLSMGIKKNVANAILVKINQIGTISETFATIELAKCNNYSIIVSHRSGESEDSVISDIAVACNAFYIKTGSMSRSERICKYNQLIRIEQQINNNDDICKTSKFNQEL